LARLNNPKLKVAELLIVDIENHLTKVLPDKVEYFRMFANEALFAREWLDQDLASLPNGSEVLEVGAGLMIMSAILVNEGFRVYALEPVGQGFSEFRQLQNAIVPYLVERKVAPEVIALPIEQLEIKNKFDFGFSVNVMEHIDDVEIGITNIVRALKTNGCYRFICPNYHFPYEPHFNIPTFFSKKLTEFFLGNYIFKNNRCNDPIGTWKSLNWITVRKVNKYCKKINAITFFNKSILVAAFERSITDKIFRKRRSQLINLIISFMVYFRLHFFTTYLPAHLLPLMDCKVMNLKHGSES
jgi:SAM-dependent methyltransferase